MTITFDTFDCDGCERWFSMKDVHIVWHQPWHKQYWGQIFWTCPDCADQFGAVPSTAGNPNYEIVEGVNDAET